MTFTALLSRFANDAALRIPVKDKDVEEVKGSCCTHVFINGQARQILNNDGYKKMATFYSLFADPLDKGVVWVDSGLKSACHHYDPDTDGGIWFWPSAAEKISFFYAKALRLWQGKKHDRSLFFLGAAVHLLQDLCVPHHAACKVFSCHLNFESWVEKRRFHYGIDTGGIYGLSKNPRDWLVENAKYAKRFLCMVENNSAEGFHTAAKILLPRAQQTTAGLLHMFYNKVMACHRIR